MPPLPGYKVVSCWWLKVLSEGKKELLSVAEEKVVIRSSLDAGPPRSRWRGGNEGRHGLFGVADLLKVM